MPESPDDHYIKYHNRCPYVHNAYAESLLHQRECFGYPQAYCEARGGAFGDCDALNCTTTLPPCYDTACYLKAHGHTLPRQPIPACSTLKTRF